MGLLSLSPGSWIGDAVKNALTGPLIGGMVDGYKAKLSAENNTDKLLADMAAREIALRQQQQELDDRQLQRDEGRWWTALPRAIVCYSIAIYIFKVIVWDIVLGLGTTISLKDPLIVDAFGKVLVVWFGGRTLEKMTGIVFNRISKR